MMFDKLSKIHGRLAKVSGDLALILSTAPEKRVITKRMLSDMAVEITAAASQLKDLAK